MLSQFLRRAFGLWLAVTLSVGCSSEPGSESSASRQAVLGGEPTGESHGGVLYVTAEVRNLGGTSIVKIGSSALIAPNLLVTALHVVSQNPSNVPFTCDTDGMGSSGASLGALVAAEKVQVFAGPEPTGEPLARGQRILSTRSTTICQNDLAFVVLDQPLDFPTYRVHRGNPVALGDPLTVVGYGSGLNSTQETAVRSERAVNVTAVGQWIRTFTVSAGPCEGDSGGPALSASGEIAGVFSTVGVDCTSANAAAKYTDVSYFSRLVEQAFDAAGAGSPWDGEVEGGAGAPGQAGAPTIGGEAAVGGKSAAPLPPAEADRDDSAGCSLHRPQHGRGSFLLAMFLGVMVSRRVGARRRT